MRRFQVGIRYLGKLLILAQKGMGFFVVQVINACAIACTVVNSPEQSECYSYRMAANGTLDS